MDFTYPTGNRRVSVRVSTPQMLLELQQAVVDGLENPDSLMQNMRITGATANCFGDDVALSLDLHPTTQAKMMLLRSFVQNVDNCRVP